MHGRCIGEIQMRHTLKKSVLLAISSLTVQSVFAEENTLNPIVVTATRTEQSINNTLAPVTLISRKDIEQSQATSLLDLLSQQSGIDIASNGGIGSNSSLFTRGTDTSHTLLIIDGVKMGSATTGQVSFQHIPLQLIDRIEILRGPRSSLYGSEAIGGVIQIFTRKGTEETKANIFVSQGTYNTTEVSTGVSGSTGSANFSLQAAYLKTDGINALSTSNPDKDGYVNKSINASFVDIISDKLEIGFNLFLAKGNVDYDSMPGFSSPNALTDDNSTQSLNRAISTDIKLFLTDNWDSLFKFSNSRDESEQFVNGATSSFINTDRNQITWQNDIQIMDSILLTLGYDYIDDKVDSTQNYAKTTRNNKAVFAQLQNNYEKQDIILALRSDKNEAFGSHTTGNIDWRYKFSADYSITASYGQAFKAPTFNDLYWPASAWSSGNPNLKPESSKSAEIISRGKIADIDWSVNIYQTKIDDLIDWAPNSSGIWQPTNISKAKIEGIEGSLATRINSWDIQFQFNLLDPVNTETDEKLIRRSRKNANLNIDKKFAALSAGISIEGHGKRPDKDTSTYPSSIIKLAGYGLLNIHASYQLTKNLQIKAKIDNALDKEYATAFNYNTLDRTVYVSASYLIP